MIAIRYNDKSNKPPEYLNFLSEEPHPYDHNMIQYIENDKIIEIYFNGNG